MKKLKRVDKALLIFSLLLCVSWSSYFNEINKSATSKALASFPVPIEDTADLCTHPVAVRVAESEILLAYQTLSVNNHSLAVFIQSVDSASIRYLRNYVLNARALDPDCGDYLTALRIYLGLNETDDSICLLYQPVLLCKGERTDDIYQPKWSYQGYFKYNGFIFEPSSNTACLSNYESKIQFIESNGTVRNFNTQTDSAGDTKSLLFTFQELDSVLISNKSEVINFWNSALSFSFNSQSNTKHSLLLSPQQYGLNDFKSRNKRNLVLKMPFVGNFANRSHLCPPSCDELFYKKHIPGTHCP